MPEEKVLSQLCLRTRDMYSSTVPRQREDERHRANPAVARVPQVRDFRRRASSKSDGTRVAG